jgi:hypothetical protein
MSLQIELEPEVQERLQQEAARRGLEAADYARRLIQEGLPAPLDNRRKAVIELLDSWLKEDATDDPAQIQAAEKELEAFKRAMNENRAGERPVFP